MGRLRMVYGVFLRHVVSMISLNNMMRVVVIKIIFDEYSINEKLHAMYQVHQDGVDDV